ncbi:unnamed protein product, partial [Iphiclides podalirius]
MSIIPYFYDVARPLRMMERDLLHSPLVMAPGGFFGPQFGQPWGVMRDLDSFLRPVEQISREMEQLALNEVPTKISSDAERFQVNVDVQHFAPEEVSVKVADGHVVVEGKHEERRDQHGYVSRRFVRRYALPQGCLPDTVQSSLSSDGILTVTAPKVLAMPSIGERIVPITPTGPVKKLIGSPEVEGKTEEPKDTSN